MSRAAGALGGCGVILAAVSAAPAQARPTDLSPGEGRIDVPGGQVWYRVVGHGPGTPLLLVHGCCGAASYYLKPLAALANERPVIFYDQLGAGHSDHPSDTTIWAINRRVEEIERLRQALRLGQFHLYGHSGGAVVAIEYLLAHPAGVQSLLLAGTALHGSRFLADLARRRASLPDSIRTVLERHEQAGTCDDLEYAVAQLALFQRFHARRLPWSADLDSSIMSYKVAQELYRKMGGTACSSPNESTPYDMTTRLRRIGVPTLFIAGQYDYTTAATQRYYQRRVRAAQLVIVPGSGHLTMHDQPELDLRAIRRFLRGVERRPPR